MYNREFYLKHKKENPEKFKSYAKKWNNSIGYKIARGKYDKSEKGKMAKSIRDKRYHRKRDKTVLKNTNLMKNYGISLDQFNQMVTVQDGKCAICAKPFKNSKDTCVDHNHNSDKVRQLLCIKCNFLVGICGENTSILQKAIEYLNKWNV